jgi:hypothetical protein
MFAVRLLPSVSHPSSLYRPVTGHVIHGSIERLLITFVPATLGGGSALDYANSCETASNYPVIASISRES